MKNKKTVGILLSITAIATLLTGCGKEAETAQAAEQQKTTTASEQETDTQATAEAQDDQLSAIQKAGKIVVGVEGTYPPFTYHDEDGTLVGYDVEVAKKIGEYFGVEVEFVESDWDSLLAGVDSGRLDTVINDVTVTEERKGKYDFSQPYFYSSRQITVAAGNPENLQTLEDLKGKKVAINSTNAYVSNFEELGVTIVPIDSSEEQANMILSGRTDFGTFSNVILADYKEQHPDAGLEVAFVIPDSEEQIAIPVRKGETRLLEEINAALQKYDEDGTLAEISNTYFQDDFTKTQQ